MTTRDRLRVTSVGLRARPLRAALSALGIAIGTAAIVAVLGLSSSSQAGLLAEIDRLGTNLLTVAPGQSLTGGKAVLPARGADADHAPERRRPGGPQRPAGAGEGLSEPDDPGEQHRRPAGAGREPEPAVRARHRRRPRALAERGDGARAGRRARLRRRPTAGRRPHPARSAGLAGRSVVQRGGHPPALPAGTRPRQRRLHRLPGGRAVPRLREPGPRPGAGRPAELDLRAHRHRPGSSRCSRCSPPPPTPRRRSR